MVSSPQLTCSELERADKTLNACCVCNPHKLGDDIHNQRINRYPNNCKSQKYLGRNFFSFSLSIQIPCLIRFIVQVLSNFFECVLYIMWRSSQLVIPTSLKMTFTIRESIDIPNNCKSQKYLRRNFFSFILCLSPDSYLKVS